MPGGAGTGLAVLLLLFLDPVRIHRGSKGNEVGRYPVPVTVLDLLIELVIVKIEFRKIAQSALDGFPDTPEAVLDVKVKIGSALSCVTEAEEFELRNGLEGLPGCPAVYDHLRVRGGINVGGRWRGCTRERNDIRRRGLSATQHWLSSSDRLTNRIPADKELALYPAPRILRSSTDKQSEHGRHAYLEQLVYQDTRSIDHRHVQRTPVLVEREVE